jgi:hypothetical protein
VIFRRNLEYYFILFAAFLTLNSASVGNTVLGKTGKFLAEYMTSQLEDRNSHETARSHLTLECYTNYFNQDFAKKKSEDSEEYNLDGTEIWVRFPAEARHFTLLHSFQASSLAYPTPYTMGIGESFPGGKAAGAWKLITHLHPVPRSRMVQPYLQLPTRLHGEFTVTLLMPRKN